ncbi:hypothetical protein LJY25_16420 [Hymenobacter sp. BT175]|nr:hypothetical protein [Hymenobacter translucens]
MNLLTTVAECDQVLSEAADERAELEFRQVQLQRLHSMGTGKAAELQVELTGATSEYNTLAALLPGMAEGNAKKRNEREYKRLEYRIYVLTQQQSSGQGGILTRFKRQYELNCLAQSLIENNTLKTEVEARRAAL